MENGIAIYDTTFQYERTGSMQWNSSMNNGIAENFLSGLPSVEDRTIFSSSSIIDVYVNNVKVTLRTWYCDPSYWNIFNHKILEGRVIDQADMDQAAKVVVISTKTAQEYFGIQRDVVGKEMELDGDYYKVIGLFNDNSKVVPFVSPDIAMPYTVQNLDYQDSYYHGFFAVILKKASNISAKQVKDEIAHAASLVTMDHPSKPEGYNELLFLSKNRG